MRIIGVTGGVGAGKTEILNYLSSKYNAKVLVLDEIARELQAPGGAIYEAMLEMGGGDVRAEDGTLDRRLFAEKMFRDPELRQKVNGMVHPAVKEAVKERLRICEETGCALCVIEAALLIEGNYKEICDELWYIYSSEERRRERLKETRGYTDRLIDRIFKSQLSEDDYRRGCDVVIDNDGEFTATIARIDRALAKGSR